MSLKQVNSYNGINNDNSIHTHSILSIAILRPNGTACFSAGSDGHTPIISVITIKDKKQLVSLSVVAGSG